MAIPRWLPWPPRGSAWSGWAGVGSWAVEALARSAVGHITLIDMDHVAESNINRQLPAIEPELGRAKVQVLRERIALINPACRVETIEDFLTVDNLRGADRRGPRLGA